MIKKNQPENKLLTREDFRDAVFKRDEGLCVICEAPAMDAHHIMERRLFPDGGYYLNNGAAVCDGCHFLCEYTVISVEEVRAACDITSPVIPPHLYADQSYDKWGNPILENGKRLKGEMFDDPGVQKCLAAGKMHHLFDKHIKYPRTYHLPWSESITDDDRVMESPLFCFEDKEVIVTEKMDGECSTLYSDYMHARTINNTYHESRDWLKQFWSTIKHDIPEDFRICGENLYAKHSIQYNNLDSYFYGFSIWNGKNECLSWIETMEWFILLGIHPVPVLYRGVYNEKRIRECFRDDGQMEGYVVRLADSFHYKEFKESVAKFVRKNHVQPSAFHWRTRRMVEKNTLR